MLTRQRWYGCGPLAAVWLSSCCLIVAGCAVGGRSVSIDSNSRVPFFGLELKERGRKSNGPPLHSIRSESSSTARIEPLRLAKSPGKRGRSQEKPTAMTGLSILVPVTRADTQARDESTEKMTSTNIDFR